MTDSHTVNGQLVNIEGDPRRLQRGHGVWDIDRVMDRVATLVKKTRDETFIIEAGADARDRAMGRSSRRRPAAQWSNSAPMRPRRIPPRPGAFDRGADSSDSTRRQRTTLIVDDRADYKHKLETLETRLSRL